MGKNKWKKKNRSPNLPVAAISPSQSRPTNPNPILSHWKVAKQPSRKNRTLNRNRLRTTEDAALKVTTTRLGSLKTRMESLPRQTQPTPTSLPQRLRRKEHKAGPKKVLKLTRLEEEAAVVVDALKLRNQLSLKKAVLLNHPTST